MKGRLAIFITVALMLVILVALNAASYVRVEDEVLSEFNPDRSTFNADATGTRAFYTFLEQSGHQVSRWGRPPSALLSGASAPANFVVVGKTRVDVESEDAEAILKWVEGGGRLVIIDRVPPASLVPAAGGWRVSAEITEYPGPEVRPDNTETMTRGVPLITPAQPTVARARRGAGDALALRRSSPHLPAHRRAADGGRRRPRADARRRRRRAVVRGRAAAAAAEAGPFARRRRQRRRGGGRGRGEAPKSRARRSSRPRRSSTSRTGAKAQALCSSTTLTGAGASSS